MMHKGVIKTRGDAFFPLWLRQRELGQRLPLGHSDALHRSLYSSISPRYSWGGEEISRSGYGLSCLEFSPDGSLLVAGYEKNSLLMFDPLSRRLIFTVHNPHEGGVKIVKFLDSRIFAAGGDNETVSLWDTRNLKSQFCSLVGESNVMVNIEFSRKNDLIITSGNDGIIYVWDTKNWNQRGVLNNKTLMSHVLVRLRLNPDETKMVISTASGYLLIVHDLNLNTLAQDLDEFEKRTLGLSSLRQAILTSRQISPNRRTNRAEIVKDFPNAGVFNMVSALEIHPQGWSAFSRSTSKKSRREWTCVHDIQEKDSSETGAVQVGHGGPEGSVRATSPTPGPSSAPPDPLEVAGPSSTSASPALPSLPPPNSRVSTRNRRVYMRFPRLTHYIEEPSSEDEFIENLGVSADGRLVCSPLGCGFRLLAFSPECSEQSVSWCGTRPRRLYELSVITSHSDNVLCTKFSPRHCLLVSGCSDGKLVWHQPVL